MKNKVIVRVNQCNRFEDVSRVCIFICKSSPYHFCSSNFHIPNGIAVDEGLNLDPSDERQDLSQCIASEKTMKRITAVARGRVQGVGYRYLVTDCAREAGVSGFVKNNPDGSVLIVAEGGQVALEVFLKLVRASDEPVIRVDDISVSTGEAIGEFSGFWVSW